MPTSSFSTLQVLVGAFSEYCMCTHHVSMSKLRNPNYLHLNRDSTSAQAEHRTLISGVKGESILAPASDHMRCHH